MYLKNLHIVLIVGMMVSSLLSYGQVVMGGGSGSGCSGTFYDPGGGGDYSNNTSETFTLCSSTPGEQVQLDFSAFDLELNGDFLTVYNGNSTAAPLLGTYTGNISPGYIQGSNASGCLTFVFTSNGSGTGAGWEAAISCGLPCQTVIADVTTGPVDADGYVNICSGDNVVFNGFGTYPQNNTNYFQSDGTSTFEWNFGNGNTATGQTVMNTFNTPGIFDVELVITDINGCISTNDINIFVQVPDQPDFTGTGAAYPTICLGDTNILDGMVNPVEIDIVVPPATEDVTIPSGNGDVVSGNTVSIFNPGQTFTNASNLSSVCVDLEYSDLSSVEIELVCPNGQSIILQPYGGGAGVYLGNPVDGAPGVGSGFNYCFSASGTTTLANGPTVVSGTPPGNSIEAGTYLPFQSFAGLIGCPLNGNWYIQVNHASGVDDGNVFQWDIEFNPVILPGGSQYIPNILDSGWEGDPTIISTDGEQIVVAPTEAGTACYTYTAEDEFGCPYEFEVCFTVLGPGEGGCPECIITNFTANSVIAQCSDQYTTTGVIEFVEAPNSGSLIVEDCQGNVVVADTYPFTSPVNYTLVGTNADGNTCTFHAYFTGDTSCTQTINFTYPPAYPSDEAGSVTPSMQGYSTQEFVLCNTDIFNAESDDNWIVPLIPPNVDPGLGYLVYSCPPGPGGIGVDPFADPCYVSMFTLEDITLINNGGSSDAFLQSLGALTDNTFYLVPMTFNSIGNATITSDCYDLDLTQLITVQYLNPITSTATQDCYAGTATVTIVGGGYPEFYGGNYTASNLFPANASFVNTTAGIGGTIALQGLTNGQNWSFTLTDGVGCPHTVNGVFSGPEDASFSYSDLGYCVSAVNPVPTITGVPGGVFSSGAGLTLNPVTGEIDVASSTPGIYTVSYTSPAMICPGTATASITIDDIPVVVGGVDQTVCEGMPVTLSGSGAATYAWTGGVTDNVPFSPVIGTTTYTVTGTTAYGCTATDQVDVIANPGPTVDAGVNQTLCEGDSTFLTGSGTPGLIFTWNNGVSDGVYFVPPVGTTVYVVTGIEAGTGCAVPDSLSITVNPLPDLTVTGNQTTCIGSTVTLTASGATTYSWTNGITNGVAFTPPLGNSDYTVTGTTLGCSDTLQVTVTVLDEAPIFAGLDTTICIGSQLDLSSSGGVSYVWDNGLGNGSFFSVSPTMTTIYTVTGMDANGCAGSDDIQVTVTPLPIIDAGPDQSICIGGGVVLAASGGVSYVWDNGVIDNVEFFPTVGTQTYSVVGTDANGCQNSDAVNVTVNPLPTVNAGTDQVICIGEEVILTGFGTPVLIWDNGVTNGVGFNPMISGIYTLIGTDINGCQDTDEVNVTVNPLPIVSGGPDLVLCQNTPITLSGTGANTFVWDNGVQNGVQFTPPLGTSTYMVTGEDANGCQNFDLVNVTVNPNPVPVIPQPYEYCQGSTLTLTTTLPYSSYLWSDGSSGSTMSATIANNPVSITVTNEFGCVASAGGYVLVENPNISTSQTIEICLGDSVLIHGTYQNTSGLYSQLFTAITGCDSVSNVTLIVHDLPVINAGPDVFVCTPNQIILAAGGGISYIWDNAVTNGVAFNQPIGTNTYNVVGTDANGCENTDQVDVTVYPLPVVTANSDTSICFGEPITLSGSGAINYMWTFGVIQDVAFVPLVSNSYMVTGTDVNGCQNTAQVSVIVNPLPIIDGGIVMPVCQGQQVLLNATGASSFEWDQGVVNGIPFTPPVGTTSYAVIGTDPNGCHGTDQAVVTVYPLPVVSAGPDQFLCEGHAVILSASGASTYVWSGGVQNGVPFTPSMGVTTYTVTGTSVNNCTNTDQVVITVNPLPVINGGPDVEICIGDFVVLSGAGGIVYSWDNNVINGASFVPEVGTTVYTVTGTDANGCENTDQVVITVNPLPVVDAGPDVLVCAGTEVALTASGANTYSWSGGLLNGVPFVPLQSSTYTVIGTSTAGCQASDQVTVTVEALPMVTYSPNITFGCAPLTVTFTNNTNGVDDCLWTFSDGTILSGCGTVTHTFTDAGCYDVTLTSTSPNGCVGETSDLNLICVEALPEAAFTSSQTVMTNYNTTCEFTNMSTGASTYVWTFGDGQNSFEENPVYTFPGEEDLEYLIRLIAYSPSGCPDTAYQRVSVTTELIYYVPNTFTPDGDEVNPVFLPIFTTGIDIYEYTLLIFNRWGEVIFESHDPSKGWNGRYGVDGDVVQDDVYVWKIYFKEKNNENRHVLVGHVNVLK